MNQQLKRNNSPKALETLSNTVYKYDSINFKMAKSTPWASLLWMLNVNINAKYVDI